MGNARLSVDPFNLIITGVGGQGNVMASRVLGNMLSLNGFHVTIGETFGASQRGGSVMSHVRVSAAASLSPQIARGKGHMVIALEPKLIFPGQGVVGIENTHVVTEDGLEQLGRFPEEIMVI